MRREEGKAKERERGSGKRKTLVKFPHPEVALVMLCTLPFLLTKALLK